MLSKRMKELRKMYPVRYVSKEQNKKLPKAGWHIRWQNWWFRSRFEDFKEAWKNRKQYDWYSFKRNCLFYANYYGTMRYANARDIWLGPLQVTIPCRWIEGPARTYHPEVFK